MQSMAAGTIGVWVVTRALSGHDVQWRDPMRESFRLEANRSAGFSRSQTVSVRFG